jgi:hypothetical protein
MSIRKTVKKEAECMEMLEKSLYCEPLPKEMTAYCWSIRMNADYTPVYRSS